MRALICIAILAFLVGCGGGGGGSAPSTAPSPPGPSLPPPPPAPPPDAPAATMRADGIWITEVGADESAQLFMHDGFVIVSKSHAWPSTALMAAGVYQISGEQITAQFTSMRSGFPHSGFSGTVTEGSDGDENHPILELEFTTNEGTVRTELRPRVRDRISFDGLVRVWNDAATPVEETLAIYSDGRLAFQDIDGCAASGSLRLHDMDLLILSFDMQGCPVAVRNGAYRGIGYSRGRDWEIGQTLWIAAANDTNPNQFFSWWLFPN